MRRTQFLVTLLQIEQNTVLRSLLDWANTVLVTLPLTESNIVLSLLPDWANTVHDYLALDFSKFSSQSTSRLKEYNSWLPYL